MRNRILFTALTAIIVGCGWVLLRPDEARVIPVMKDTAAVPLPETPAPESSPPTVPASTALAPKPPPQPETLQPFSTWAQHYLATPPTDRAALVEEGVQLARARRPVFKQLIQDDPRRAIAEAVPMVVRQQLPTEVVALLEARVSGQGVLRQYFRPFAPGSREPSVLRYVELERGETYQAYAYGRRTESAHWSFNTSVNGVAIDSDLAVNESPLRPLEVGEIPDSTKPAVTICPVSGNVTEDAAARQEPISEETPAVEARGEIVYLCDGTHATVYEQLLIQGESSSGGAQSFTGILPSAPTPSVGMVKVLYINVLFADQERVTASESTLHDTLRQTAEFYQTASYGRLTLIGTVTPPIRLPRNQAWYKGKDTTDGFIKEIDGLGLEMSHAKEAARKAGYDWQTYDCTMVRSIGGARSPTSFGGGGNVWMRTDSVSVASHEIGHAFGLAHANFWLTNGASVIGPGGNEEYGDQYDNMGTGSPPTAHWNVQAKNQIKWLPDEFAPPVTASGTYRLYAFDTPQIENGKRYGLRIRKDNERTYWGEYRTLIASNNWVANGMLLGWKWPTNAGSNLHLLDTTPGSVNGKNDAPITVGRTFSDTESGIHLTTVAVNGTTPPSIDVVVNLGQFPTNHPPTFTLSPATAVVPTNVPVTFTATASDPDGDVLSYGWIWHDGTISPNAAAVTRTFSNAGVYTLSCIVSDMKGGTTTRNAVITVGNGNSRFTISGRITKGGVGVANINVTTSGTNGVLTDSDGRYTISNLTAATYTVTPAAHGSLFNELFNNTITVGPSFTGADFTIDDLPIVSITTPVATATENGAAGQFRLTRTGSTALPLTVYVFTAQGTAVRTSDYSFSPDYTTISGTPWATFTIPADEAYLDISVTTANDAVLEGPETVSLELGLDAAYLVGDPNLATVTIQDDDTALPRVSLTCAPAFVMENGGQNAVFTVSRTGSSAAELAVAYTVSATSTASAGSDYTALSGSVTIPVGASSATVEVTPINDSVSEITETVTVAVTINTGLYVTEAAASTGLTARIVDDDTQIVSLSVSDAAAAEVDRTAVGALPNPGTYLVTRSGDLSNALTVYYGVAGTALHGIDYEPLPGTVVIPAGARRAPITIMPRVDSYGEAPETVLLSLAAGNGNYQLGETSSGTVTIADANQPPLVEVTPLVSPAMEGTGGATFQITAKGGNVGTLAINYTISGSATAGVDYTIPGLDTSTLTGTATVTVNNNTTFTTLIVTVTDDGLSEGTETITLTIDPSANYTTWDVTRSATVLLIDNEQPSVFVDPQVGTTGNDFVAESAATTCKFFISRTGSTGAALNVGYTMIGTATNGSDYSSLSGTATIPAGAAGVDVSFTPTQDTTFEGTETVTMHLNPGSYSPGPDATVYITDDDAGNRTVAFPSPGGSGLESTTTVNIPVVLSSAAPGPVTVEYSLEAGARTTTMLNGTWVRVVRTGNNFESFSSADGVTWSKRSSTRAISMSSTSYYAGFVVTSTVNGTAGSVRLDNFSVTNLSGGGSAGAMISGDFPGATLAGSDLESGGVFQAVAGGTGFGTAVTDSAHYVLVPISNAANCTVTARVLSVAGTVTNVRAGATLRETTANDARHLSCLTDGNLNIYQFYRTTAAAAGATATINAPTYAKPRWLRLTRVGHVFTASTSADGSTFTPIGGGSSLPMDTTLLVGLATAARTDGQLARATFDNVTLSPAPVTPLRGRAIGFVNEPGGDSVAGGTYHITGSGAGILASPGATEDEGYFFATPLAGDFTFTARLVSLQGGASNAQAGLMVRESNNHRGRCVYFGLTGSSTTAAEFRARTSSGTTGEGFGVDYSLPPGVLTFEPGETTKNIVLNVTDDVLPEPSEYVNVLLRNANAAALGATNTYTYTIEDDDAPTTLPVIGFASTTSAGFESNTPAQIHVALSEAHASTVEVGYATSGASTATDGVDFSAVSGTLIFAPGETIKSIDLPLLNDTQIESNETVVLTLADPIGAVLSTTTTHTFTIVDDDAPFVSIAASDDSATEGGGSGEFTFTRTGPTDASLTVNFSRSGSATSGSDFTAFSPATSIVIPVGQSSATLAVNPVQNTSPEANETVSVSVVTGTGYAVGSPNFAVVTIFDDDVNTVTIAATDAQASEAGSNPGELTLTRTGPTTSALNVALTVTGTAASGTDFSTISTTASFSVGQSSRTISVNVLPDTLTEGNEEAVISINTSSSYLVGTPSVAGVTIVDDDLPPSVFISSPESKATVLAAGNGLVLTATGSDDGLPSPLAYTWSKTFGPGTVTFGTPNGISTTAEFAAPGVYGVRVTVNDGQFSATDDLFVQSGGFAYANWVSSDQGPPGIRGVSGESNGVFTLIGSGAGYTGTNDSGHMLFRQLLGGNGDCTIIARLVSLSGPSTALAGLTVRDTSWKGARRANLVIDAGGTLQFRRRTTPNLADTATNSSGLSLPRWLRLVRSGPTVLAYSAPDVGGAPGTWVPLGTEPSITMNANVVVGMVVSAGAATSSTAAATFDNVTVTPSFNGAALHAEDLGNNGAFTSGNSSEAGGVVTINAIGSHDGSGSHFRYRQVWGDCTVQARVTSHSGATRGAQTGVAIRDTTDNGGFAFYGYTTTDGNQVHWRSSPGGNTGTLQTGGALASWFRLVRRGNTVNAFRATDVAGSPGAWVQVSSNIPVAMTGPLLVGLLVDSNNIAQTATGTLLGFSVSPLNTAPVVNIAAVPTLPPFTLDATITDDGQPSSPGTVSLAWSKLAGPGSVGFGNLAASDTTATLSLSGDYTLRLMADDGDTRAFRDISFSGYLTQYDHWKALNFGGDPYHPDAALTADPDHDGIPNIFEYAFDLSATAFDPAPWTLDQTTIGSDKFMRLTIPKNPAATDVTYDVQATGDMNNPASWDSAGLFIEENTSTTLRVRDSVPMNGGGKRFMRAKVSQ